MIQYLMEKFNEMNFGYEFFSIKQDEKDFNIFLISDKLVFIYEYNQDSSSLWDYISKLPGLRDDILIKVKEEEKMFKPLEELSLVGLLWDLYVVVLNNKSNGKTINQFERNAIENDKFVAKKIIIEYEDDNKFLDEFIKHIYPQFKLDSLIKLAEFDSKLNDFKNLNESVENINTINRTLSINKSTVDLETLKKYIGTVEGNYRNG